jgi:hypothetical protein
MRLPSFRLCFDSASVSKFQINKERMKYNISGDFDLYSLLLDRRKFNAREFIKCGVKVEFYKFTDGLNKNCKEFEEYVDTEIHLKFGSKSNDFCYCLRYDNKNLKIQRLSSKSNPFLKISIPINISTYKLLMHFEFIGIPHKTNIVSIELNDYFNTVFNLVMKSSITYLQNPYKYQCSNYDTNHNPFNSISREDCFHKCLQTNCFIKYKCFDRDYKYVIRRLDESSFDLRVECNQNEHKNCINLFGKCEKICPIDCLSENYFLTSRSYLYENKNQNSQNFFF